MLKRDHEKIIRHYQIELSKEMTATHRLRKRIMQLAIEKAILEEKFMVVLQICGDAIASGVIDEPEIWAALHGHEAWAGEDIDEN